MVSAHRMPDHAAATAELTGSRPATPRQLASPVPSALFASQPLLSVCAENKTPAGTRPQRVENHSFAQEPVVVHADNYIPSNTGSLQLNISYTSLNVIRLWQAGLSSPSSAQPSEHSCRRFAAV